MNKLREKPWFNHAVAACIAVMLFVVLTNFDRVWERVQTFFGYFRPVITACVIAYIVNPLSKLYAKSVFRWVKRENLRIGLSNFLAFLTVILAMFFLLLTLVPQIIDSVRTFTANLDGYVASLTAMLDRVGVSASMLELEDIINSSEALIKTLTDIVKRNLTNILSTSMNVGRTVVQLLIAFLLSIYMLANKKRLKAGGKRLLNALLGDARYEKAKDVITRSHRILNRYIAFNILDALIVASANVTFMLIFGMPYPGLVSFVVAVTNLIPTFGPVVGAVIGAFVLVLVHPWQALAFLIFTVVLQTLDAYFIKPKLFGNSLGVAGLWILVGVIVGGRIFGVGGILLAIPGVAILDLLYHDYFMPWLEARKAERSSR